MKTAIVGRKTASVDNKDFWLVYSQKGAGSTLGDTIASLYYLPDNFKLMIMGNQSDHESMWNTHDKLMDRVQYESDTKMPDQTSPFSFADAIIYDDLVPAGVASTPFLIIAQGKGKDLENNAWHGFTVPSGSPEAIASAALNISRAVFHRS